MKRKLKYRVIFCVLRQKIKGMKADNNRYFLLIILLLMTAFQQTEAQVRISTYIEAGENNVSDGLYLKNSFLGDYSFGKTRIEAGSQFDLLSAGPNVFTGVAAGIAREFSLKRFIYEVQGFYMYSSFSDLVHESNLGALINVERNHFDYKLGLEFRTYRITDAAADSFNLRSNRKLHENWNIVYLVSYRLKPADNNWNTGIAISNIDHFLVNQETNPMLNIHGSYAVSSPLELYAEIWYKGAGSLNISANYFGFFIRTGLIWKIHSEE